MTVPFAPGRTDATQEQTDVESFAVLEPTSDGFRNYLQAGEKVTPETLLVERAFMLRLTRTRDDGARRRHARPRTNAGGSKHGVFTDRPGTLNNDFFVNLLDMGTVWKTSVSGEHVYEGTDRASGAGEVDGDRGRPRVRLELRAACARRGLRTGRREGEVRPRLRRRVGQGHEPRPVRPALTTSQYRPAVVVIPTAHTPPGGYGEQMPAPILARCTDAVADGVPDLRGTGVSSTS